MTIEEFIETCQKRPIPVSNLAQIQLLARELAEGASLGIWSVTIALWEGDFQNKGFGLWISENTRKFKYILERWDNDYPNLQLLLAFEYIKYDSYQQRHLLDKAAFELLSEAIYSSVFISYKRIESSAFALLINLTLKQHGIQPFVDMQLQVGDDWQLELEENIKSSDYFVILLSNKTLDSEVAIREIQWAIESNIKLIPIWHNGFAFEADDWLDLPVKVSQALSSTHTIRVLEENPLTYDTALRELLNRFGISS